METLKIETAAVTSNRLKTEITVDAGGRVLIPKELRERLGLGPGDVLELSETNQQITLTPVRPAMPLEKRHGFWVYTGLPQPGAAEAIAALMSGDREARAAALLAEGAQAEEGI